MTKTKTILPSANLIWGFWGTSGHNGYDQQMAWETVSDALATAFDLSPEKTRDLLDTAFGRHLADDLSFIPGGPVNAQAIENYIMTRLTEGRWRGWVERAIREMRRA